MRERKAITLPLLIIDWAAGPLLRPRARREQTEGTLHSGFSFFSSLVGGHLGGRNLIHSGRQADIINLSPWTFGDRGMLPPDFIERDRRINTICGEETQ